MSLTAVTEPCFECCMALVKFYHSYLFIWYVTRGYLRYMSQDLEKKDIRWILTSWKLMAVFSFIFNEVRAVPELSLKASGFQGPWGTAEPYWPWPASRLSLGAQFQLRAWHPVQAWAVLWACLSLTSSSGWTLSCLQSYLLPFVCWMDLGTAWLLCLVRGCWLDSLLWPPGSAPSSHPVGLPPCQWGHGLCWAPCASWFDPLTAQPCSHCSCRGSVYALWEIPNEKFSQTI